MSLGTRMKVCELCCLPATHRVERLAIVTWVLIVCQFHAAEKRGDPTWLVTRLPDEMAIQEDDDE